MSLAGRAATRGSRVTIYRPSGGATGDLGRKVESWEVVADSVAALIESETDERMQQVFGTPELVKNRIYFPGLPDVRVGDAVRAVDLKRAGERYRVAAVLRMDISGRPHVEAAAQSTTESVGVPCGLGGSTDGTCTLSGTCGCALAPNGDCILAES